MTKSLIVSNIGVRVGTGNFGATVPTIDAATTGDPEQIFRCTDNTIFRPTLIIATNTTATATHRLLLVDADLTDAGTEEAYKDDLYALLDINIGASATVILEGDKIPSGLQFRYGVAGYVTDATLDVKVYIEGTEHFITTTG